MTAQMNYFENFVEKRKVVKPEPKGRKVRRLEMGVTGEMLMRERGILQKKVNGKLTFEEQTDEQPTA